jgi:membrane fusion protein, copper/silver efflux system
MKSARAFTLGALLLIVAAGAGYGLYQLGMSRGMRMASAPSKDETKAVAGGEAATRRHIEAGLKAGDIDPVNGKKILYYYDPMAPGKRFDAPGKSPFMDMMLVPQYAEDAVDSGTVAVSPRIRQSVGLRTAEVTRDTLTPKVEVTGNVAWNERLLHVVPARATGFVERLHVRAALDRVAAGAPLVDLYVPDWVAAQEEFLAVRRMQGEGLAALVDAARARMRQAGMDEQQIALVERSNSVQAHITLTSPVAGVVTELMVRDGMTVMAGMALARINGIGSVWVNAEVPESQTGLVHPGAKVTARLAGDDSTTLTGQVQTLLPDVNPVTRTVRARIELPNPHGRLTPGMFVTLSLATAALPVLTVPSEAIIATGERSLVMLAESDGSYRPVAIVAGIETGGRTEIKRGLSAGQKVVVSGQFLLDSEASLRSVEARGGDSTPAKPAPSQGSKATPSAPSAEHHGSGKLESIEADGVMLAHGPIPSLKWGEMTMLFLPPENGLPKQLKPGAEVEFSFRMTPDGPRLTRIAPKGAPR